VTSPMELLIAHIKHVLQPYVWLKYRYAGRSVGCGQTVPNSHCPRTGVLGAAGGDCLEPGGVGVGAGEQRLRGVGVGAAERDFVPHERGDLGEDREEGVVEHGCDHTDGVGQSPSARRVGAWVARPKRSGQG
jgi:hypothetical protein